MVYLGEVSVSATKRGVVSILTHIAQFTKAGGVLKALFSLPALLIARILNLSTTDTATDAANGSKLNTDTESVAVAVPFSSFGLYYARHRKTEAEMPEAPWGLWVTSQVSHRGASGVSQRIRIIE